MGTGKCRVGSAKWCCLEMWEPPRREVSSWFPVEATPNTCTLKTYIQMFQQHAPLLGASQFAQQLLTKGLSQPREARLVGKSAWASVAFSADESLGWRVPSAVPLRVHARMGTTWGIILPLRRWLWRVWCVVVTQTCPAPNIYCISFENHRENLIEEVQAVAIKHIPASLGTIWPLLLSAHGPMDGSAEPCPTHRHVPRMSIQGSLIRCAAGTMCDLSFSGHGHTRP